MRKHLIELLFADLLWGFSFVAAIWCFESLSPSATVFYRFLFSGLAAAILIGPNQMRETFSTNLREGIIGGVLLSLVFFLQLWGLSQSGVTKTAFITSLYVVIIPFITLSISKHRVPWGLWVAIGLALVGIALICQVWLIHGLSQGDGLILASSVLSAFHIWYLSHIGPRIVNSFRFNFLQIFWGGLLAIFLGLASLKNPNDSWNLLRMSTHSIWGLGVLAIGVNLVAFAIQVRVQRHLSAEVASLIYLLESPISFVFAYILLGDRITELQAVGCAVVLMSGILGVYFEKRAERLLSS